MHKIVHLFFASRIRKQLRDLTGISLNSFRFAYGNIKPDLTFSMCAVPHTISRSEKVFKKHVGELYEESLHIADFSEKLGVVMHYLCDYFCFAHSDGYPNGIIAHGVYEMRMIRTMLSLPSYKSRNRIPTQGFKEQTRCSIENPAPFLQEHYKNYLSSSHSMIDDLNRALNISQAFCQEAIRCWCNLCIEPIESTLWVDAESLAAL